MERGSEAAPGRHMAKTGSVLMALGDQGGVRPLGVA